jgi:serine/threonine protein kinase
MESRDSNQMLQVGTKLQDGKYVIKKQLSSGGFGNTYIVVDKQFEDEFALKEFFIKGINDRPDDSTNVSISNAANTKLFESQKEKFKKEARRLRKLNNKHIVRVYDLFEENDTAYYVMDFINGESLSTRLKTTGVPLSEKEALGIMEQILDALEEVHNLKIWHLDLKPGNILVNDKGNAVLIDFGASKQISSGEGYETTTTSMCYTPGYAPSEQVDQNMDRIGPWTDLYALGATLYNLLTCTAPPTVSEIQEGNAFKFPAYISEKTRKLVEWMMTPARIKRPQSVADVRNYLLSNKPDEKPENDEVTILEGNTGSGRNNYFSPNTTNVRAQDELDDVDSDDSELEQESNNNMWIIIGGIVAVVIVILLFSISGNKTVSSDEWAVDSDSIVVVDSAEVEWYDSVSADTAAVW